MFLNSNSAQKIHCIGIGGIGVSGLAEILLQRGYQVSGSDKASSVMVERLRAMGAKIYPEHLAHQVQQTDLVVYSSAIAESNPELQAARQQGIVCVRRGELLAELMGLFLNSIAVAGTHGKTTTTALITHMLRCLQLAPHSVVGGVINGMKSPIHVGNSEYFIAEADESDASFLHMHPKVAVVTGVEADHLENYDYNFDQLCAGFLQFIEQSECAILCADDPVLHQLKNQVRCPMVSYGFSAMADIQIIQFLQEGLQSYFTLRTQGRNYNAVLNLAGRHNVLNALAALGVGMHYGLDIEQMLQTFITFPGVGRRLQFHGVLTLSQGQVDVYEDYGHHPSELLVTLSAVRSAWPNRRVVWVFQPHRYSRTRDLWLQFVEVLNQSDDLILTDIYAAGELPIEGVSSAALLAEVKKTNPQKQAIYLADFKDLKAYLLTALQGGEVVLFQGAGSIGQWASNLCMVENAVPSHA